MPEEYLEIRGARVHNLKNIDLRLPHNQLIVVTGVSGSGKTSLVFDIIHAEGRRRYVESLSSYARQFLERLERPDVDEVLGIAPTVAIRQKNTTRNPRSTVATTTEIYDFLRLLFARAGRTHCTRCGQQVMRDDVDSVARSILALEHGSRWLVLFPARSVDSDGDSWFRLDSGLGPAPAGKARLAELPRAGIQQALSRRQDFSVLRTRVAAGRGLWARTLRSGRSHRHNCRYSRAHRGRCRDRIPRERVRCASRAPGNPNASCASAAGSNAAHAASSTGHLNLACSASTLLWERVRNARVKGKSRRIPWT